MSLPLLALRGDLSEEMLIESEGASTVNNVGTLRKLNSVLFPVSYSDKFYKDVLDPKVADFCKFGASRLCSQTVLWGC